MIFTHDPYHYGSGISCSTFLLNWLQASVIKDTTGILFYLNLFTFSMLLLVLSNNFLLMFIGWEAVGCVLTCLSGSGLKKIGLGCCQEGICGQ